MKFMNKAIFLDRDGTIIKDKGYTSNPDEIEFLDGVDVALKSFLLNGFKIIIVTNQSGVGRGYYSEEDVKNVNDRIRSKLFEMSIQILDFYFCPHYKGSLIQKYNIKCNCRKPHPGMISLAINAHNIDASASYMIGDKESDVLAGKKAKLKDSYLLCKDKNLLYYANLICK